MKAVQILTSPCIKGIFVVVLIGFLFCSHVLIVFFNYIVYENYVL